MEDQMMAEDTDNVRQLRPVTKAVERGRRELLLALRDRLMQGMRDPRCTPSDTEALVSELRSIEAELANLDAQADEE